MHQNKDKDKIIHIQLVGGERMLYLCTDALVCPSPLGPKHQHKDMNNIWHHQKKGDLIYPQMFVHNIHGVVNNIHT